MATEVEIKLVAQSKQYVSELQTAQKENQKLYDQNARNHKREKGLIADIEHELDSLKEKKRQAFTVQEIEKYNRKIQEATVHLKEYEQAGAAVQKQQEKTEKQVDSSIQTIGKWAAGLGLAVTILHKLKEAFLETEQGVKLFGKAVAVSKQIFQDLVNGIVLSIPRMLEAEKIADAYNQLRIKERVESITAQKHLTRYNELWLEASDQTKTATDRLKLYTQAREEHNKAIDIELQNTKEQIDITNRALKLNPTNSKSLDQLAELIKKYLRLESDKASQVRRVEGQITGIQQDEIEKRKAHVEQFQKWIEEIEFENLKKRNIPNKIGMLNSLGIGIFTEENFKIFKEAIEKVPELQKRALDKGNDIIRDSAKKARASNEEIFKINQERNEKVKEQIDNYIKIFTDAAPRIIESLTKVRDFEVEQTERKRELLDTQINELQQALETEVELYKAGFAANVSAKKAELDELKKQRDIALKNEEEARKKQLSLEIGLMAIEKSIAIASVIRNLIKANWEARAFSPLTFGQPWVGINKALAALDIGTLIVSSVLEGIGKAKTFKLAEGGHGEVKGRTHAQGGEPFLSHVEIEHGERWGVLNKRANRKYGPVFDRMVDAFNRHEIKSPVGNTNINNVIVENEGPNKRLDLIHSELKSQQRRENIIESQGMTIVRRGDSVKIIRRR